MSSYEEGSNPKENVTADDSKQEETPHLPNRLSKATIDKIFI